MNQPQRMALVALKHTKKYIQRMEASGEFSDKEGALMLKLAISMVESADDLIANVSKGFTEATLARVQRRKQGS